MFVNYNVCGAVGFIRAAAGLGDVIATSKPPSSCAVISSARSKT